MQTEILEKITKWHANFLKGGNFIPEEKFTEEEIKAWYEHVVKEQNEVPFEQALKEGRIAIRTFAKNAILEDTIEQNILENEKTLEDEGFAQNAKGRKHSSKGGISLNTAINQKLGVSASILPSLPFRYEEDGRIGLAFVNIKQEDNAFYHLITNKSFIEANPELNNIISEVKQNLSRISYFGNEDMMTILHEKKGKVVPASDQANYKLYSMLFQKDTKVEGASTVRSNFIRSKNIGDWNEALVKIRPSLKRVLLFASSEESLNEIKTMKLEQSIFKDRGIEVEYMILKQNVIEKFIENEKHVTEHRLIFEQKIIFPGNVAFEWNNETKLYDKQHVQKEKSDGETLVVKAENSSKNPVQINSNMSKPLSAGGNFYNSKKILSGLVVTGKKIQLTKRLSSSFSEPVVKAKNDKMIQNNNNVINSNLHTK